MPWVSLPDSLQLHKISGCPYTPFVRVQHLFTAPSLTVLEIANSTIDYLFKGCAFTDLTRHPWMLGKVILRAPLRLTRLQGLLEVGSARVLAAMLGGLGVSTLHSIKIMT
jgi:hypothetical protein